MAYVWFKTPSHWIWMLISSFLAALVTNGALSIICLPANGIKQWNNSLIDYLLNKRIFDLQKSSLVHLSEYKFCLFKENKNQILLMYYCSVLWKRHWIFTSAPVFIKCLYMMNRFDAEALHFITIAFFYQRGWKWSDNEVLLFCAAMCVPSERVCLVPF